MLPPREWEAKLREGAAALDLEIPDDAVESSFHYAELLLHWTKRVDLTSHTDPLEVLERHFLDSWLGSRFLAPKTRFADLGSGGGFPGLALKLIRPDLVVVSIESRNKKTVFQRTVCRELGLEIDVRCKRIEDETEQFEAATARAFAPLERLLPLAAGCLAPAGRLIAYKGPGVDDEWDALTEETRCGFEVEDRLEVRLPFSGTQRVLLVVRVPTSIPTIVPRGT